MEKPRFEFGVVSRSYEDRLRKGGHWDRFNLMRENAKTDLRNHETDYQAHREKRIAQREEEITAKQKFALQELKPPSGPVNRPLTAQQIRDRATTGIDVEHKQGYEALYNQRHTAINEFVQQTLGLRDRFDKSRSGWLREHDRSSDRSPKR
jgi:hypothetical protein